MTKRSHVLAALLLMTILVSCTPSVSGITPTQIPFATLQPSATTTLAPTSTPMAFGLYRAPEIPDALATESDRWGIPLISDPEGAALHLELASAGDESTIASRSTWVYALVAPFPTVTDGVTLDELKAAWDGWRSWRPATWLSGVSFPRSWKRSRW